MYRLLALVFSLVLSASTLGAGPAARVMLVLDASGSMWGQIDGVPKIAIAREVVAGLLQDWNSETQLGLTVYGHRRKGDCEDIETLIEVGTLDTPAFLATVNDIGPKGKTPMSAAVRRAAEALRFSEESATVILVSDGEETCGLDPCAVAKELEQAGVDFAAHVVGFDVKDAATIGQLTCLAENTGGRYFAARDSAGLHSALSEAVAQTEAPVTGLKLSAVMEAGGPLLEEGLGWTLFSAAQDASGGRERLANSYKAQPLFRLDPGLYHVALKYGDLEAASEIEVPADALVEHQIVLGSGLLAMRALLEAESPPIAAGLAWTVYEAAADLEGQRKRVSFSYDAQPQFKLAAGRYLVQVKHGDATGSRELEIKAGERMESDIVLGAGQLRMTGQLAPESASLERDLSWTVFEAEADIEGKRKRVSFSYDARPQFKLPGGRYLVTLKHGDATASTEVEVQPGELKESQILLDAGYARAAARLVTGGEPLDKDLSWEVTGAPDLEGKRQRMSYSYDAQPLFRLPAGRYRIGLKHGNAVASGDLEVRAGDLTETELVLNAGYLRVSGQDGAGSPLAAGLSWKVFAAEPELGEKRKPISFSYDATPLFRLPAGHYAVELSQNDKQAESLVEIQAGGLEEAVIVLQ